MESSPAAAILDDRKVPATKRVQVRQRLEQMIATEHRPGDAIASERELVRLLGVSRVTVRQAIADLVETGRLERVHGKGTYVMGPRISTRLHLMSFSREMRARGLVPETQVLDACEVNADDDVATRLAILPGAPVVRVERLRLADGTPMALEVGFYPSALFPGLLDHELGSLYELFAKTYGVVVSAGGQVIRAESADAAQAHVLGIARRAPLLVQERVTYFGDRQPMEFAVSAYRGDRYNIHMDLTPTGTTDRS
ncbi:GntR family transcriptional regulator [Mariniluteicoccus endophyticus]